MKLIILGSGSVLPNTKRSAPAFLLEVQNDLVLLDAGPGTLRQFAKINQDYFNLTHILISHTHADHLSDLMAIIEAMSVRYSKYVGPDKRNRPLVIIGPPGFRKIFNFLKKTMSPEIEPFQVRVYEVGEEKKDFKHWQLETKKVRHVAYWDSIAFKISEEDIQFVYSGDTAFCPEIIEFCRGVKILLLDCSMPIKEEFPQTHLNPQFASEIALLAGAKTLILFHLYDIIDQPADIKKEVAKKFKGKIIIAKDLEKIIL